MIIPMNFPEELEVEILSRLPVKSLLRFKCVSKSWCTRISAKDFPLLHFKNYKPSDLALAGFNGTCRLLIANISRFSPPTGGCANQEEGAALPFVSTMVDCPLPQQHDFNQSWTFGLEVCGPCNGIFCLYGQNEERILLWNPLIHDFKFIPQSNLPRQPLQGSRLKYTVGFGFDSETNDYKILQIVQIASIHHQQQQQVELYSLGSNSWRKLDASPLNSFCVSGLFTADGKIGWLGIQRKIYLFDVSNESFDMIPIYLEGESDSRATYLQVFPFRESIAVVNSSTNLPCGYCEIWMLNDFSGARSRSWSKLWTMQLENVYQPLGLCGNSYLIFNGWDRYRLMLYDLHNHHVVDVGTSMGRVLVYKESLISISGHS